MGLIHNQRGKMFMGMKWVDWHCQVCSRKKRKPPMKCKVEKKTLLTTQLIIKGEAFSRPVT
jgi:hypothetical protein